MFVDDMIIFRLAEQFKRAIEELRDSETFETDISFYRFPHFCCGDTCCLLAEFLKTMGINTIYAWGDCKGQTHAWLVVKDDRVKSPKPCCFDLPDEIEKVLCAYNVEYNGGAIDVMHYKEEDLVDGLIIDITADQFGEVPVYVGNMDEFHLQFEFERAHDYCSLGDYRLTNIYKKILDRMMFFTEDFD